MTSEQTIGLVITLLVMFIGLAGCLLPGIPSTPIVLIAAVGHRLYFGPNSASTWVIVVLVLITLFSALLDYLATMFGAKKLGATWKGILGSVIGATVGIFFPFPGLIVGPFIGAMLFEMIGGREIEEAARAGAGALLGLLIGAVGKFACCVAMIGLFVLSAISNSRTPLEAVAHWTAAISAAMM